MPELRSRMFGMALTIGTLLGAWQGAAAAPDLITATTKGPVQGVARNEVVEYLGIPYAAPPVGDLRWRPPKEHTPWTATRDATSFGPACAQVTLLGVFAGPANNNEDCLYLNVIAPKDVSSSKERLPVLFWIHGGGFVDGAGSDYDASKLAAQGKVVVVTINYRLSLLGFFGHPALNKEGHLFANYGLLDQQSALHWVKDNIANFGGDPDNITVAGQSAGGASAAFNVISPLTKDMFHKTIIQSSASWLAATPMEVAEKKATAFANAAGCGQEDDEATAACLRKLPVDTLMKMSGPPEAFGPYVVTPVADGQIVPSGGASAIESGNFNRMPIMNGSTRDEGNFFAAIPVYHSGKAITEADVEGYVKTVFGGNAGAGGTPPSYPVGTVDKILAQYPSGDYLSPQLRMNAIQSDVMVCRIQHGTHLLAGKVPLYVYEFRDRTAPFMFPKLPDFVPLAYHTADLQYLFPGFRGGDKGVRHELNSQQLQLSDQLVAAWTNFAKTGDPNGEGVTVWPQYTGEPNARTYLAQDIPELSTLSDDVFTADHKCSFWKNLLVYN
ncbi:carboxylesterase [Azospirillum thiophilum]|uniref:Carboxylic ester hydrolase n=2 Tax=Azospirillum thiophilum TaxID=528244 RepID=A0AAC8ZWA0_9PROT|nr:carboxylesterase/lipase family protein [Azospirillum thiophilum]ALG75309.1 carboxylesterase [Azospirillum thiophilum]KJR62225.1 carboxylesterase [Azospirillum thiophilum]